MLAAISGIESGFRRVMDEINFVFSLAVEANGHGGSRSTASRRGLDRHPGFDDSGPVARFSTFARATVVPMQELF
jgi:hypothetical protein